MKPIKYKLHIVNDKKQEPISNLYVDSDSFLLVKGPKINFKLTFTVTALPRQIIMKMDHNLTVQVSFFNLVNNRETDTQNYPLKYFCQEGNKYIFNYDIPQPRPYQNARIFIQNDANKEIKVHFLQIQGDHLAPLQQKKQTTIDKFIIKPMTNDSNGLHTEFFQHVSSDRDAVGRPLTQIPIKKKQKQPKQPIEEEDDIKKAIQLSLQGNEQQFHKDDDENSLSIIIVDSQSNEYPINNQQNILGYGGTNTNTKQQYNTNQYQKNDLGYGNQNTNQKQISQITSNLHKYSNQKQTNTYKNDEIILRYMTFYKQFEINQDFMQFHQQSIFLSELIS